MIFKKNSIVHGSIEDLIAHFIPAVIVTALFQVVAIEMYHHNPIQDFKLNFFIWSVSQAFGSFTLGLISDKYCRKRTLIITQAIGIILLLSLIKYGYNQWSIILLTGLTFSPSAIAKAALVDNFPSVSKVRIIGITFIALLAPWCIYGPIVSWNAVYVSWFTVIALIINLLLTIFYFEDRRDLALLHEGKKNGTGMFVNHKRKLKIAFTSLALIPAQIVFFLSDSFFEESSQNAPFFTMLGIGVFIGACASIFYNKVPHTAVITICYLFGFMSCLITAISGFFLVLPDTVLSVFILIFSTGGGFYLPFVYDAILSAVSSNFRGATCGLIEAVISISGIIGLLIILIFNPHERAILILMTIFFLIATILQKKGEKHA